MQIELTDAAVTWFKNELELPENNKGTLKMTTLL